MSKFILLNYKVQEFIYLLDEFEGIKLNSGNTNTGLPSPMSDTWVQYVQTKLRGEGKIEIANLVFNYDYKITKYVCAVDKIDQAVHFLKLGSF